MTPFDLRQLPGYTSSRLAFYGMAEQALAGVQFNKGAAEALVIRIDGLMREIEEEVEPKLPPRKLKKSEEMLFTLPAKPYKKDGTLSASMLKWLEKHPGVAELDLTNTMVKWRDEHYPIVGGFQVPATLPMKMANQEDIKSFLIDSGWRPTLFNLQKDARGKPVRDDRGKLIQTTPKMQEAGRLCPNLEALEGPLAKQIVRWLSLRNRKSVVEGWLGNERLAYDGRLSAGASGLTPTYRWRHSVVTNLPKADPTVILGKEMRELFVARPHPRVLNKHKDPLPDNAVYVGRPLKFGNPFVVGKDGTREECCEKHKEWLHSNPPLLQQAKEELAGKDLVCFCAPLACHADTLLLAANPKRVLVGYDASGLEARAEAHWCYNLEGGKEYADVMLASDIHMETAKRMFFDKIGHLYGTDRWHKEDPEVKTWRSKSKTLRYGIGFGAGAGKVASMLGVSKSEAEEVLETYWAAAQPAALLKKKLVQFWEQTGEKKWIRGIDGRRIRTRSEHALVNSLFQSTGAIVMETADHFMNKWLGGWKTDNQGYPCFKYKGHTIYRVCYFHDEYEYDCPEEIADEVGNMGCKSIQKAGEYLKINVPLEGNYCIGPTLADVH